MLAYVGELTSMLTMLIPYRVSHLHDDGVASSLPPRLRDRGISLTFIRALMPRALLATYYGCIEVSEPFAGQCHSADCQRLLQWRHVPISLLLANRRNVLCPSAREHRRSTAEATKAFGAAATILRRESIISIK